MDPCKATIGAPNSLRFLLGAPQVQLYKWHKGASVAATNHLMSIGTNIPSSFVHLIVILPLAFSLLYLLTGVVLLKTRARNTGCV